MNPLTSSGGYVAGTPSTPTRLPAADRRFHTAGAPRCPLFTNSMAYAPVRIRVKSNMPCLPGFTPVTQDVHAGNVAGGVVLAQGR